MIPLRVRHRTTYRYRRAVDLGPHRLMLRPRESRDLQVITLVVGVSPTSTVTWAHDVFGNAVATAVFKEPSDSLVIDSVVELRLEGTAWPIFNIAVSAIEYPFRYSNDELTDLGALLKQQYPDPTRRLANWARAFILGERTDTLSLLKDLARDIRQAPPVAGTYAGSIDALVQMSVEVLVSSSAAPDSGAIVENKAAHS
jgi:transglutaminase-like putative cysteine protease